MNRRQFGRWLLGARVAMRSTRVVLVGQGGITSGPRYFSLREAPPLTWRVPPGPPMIYNRVRVTTRFPRAQMEHFLWPDSTSWGSGSVTVSGLTWPPPYATIPQGETK